MNPAEVRQRAHRADEAARSVVPVFGMPLRGLPGTHLGRQWPGGRPEGLLNYWWQAHYADAMLDAALRASRCGDPSDPRRWVRLATQLVHTVWVRNGQGIVNDYYDDMAWMALTLQRLVELRDRMGLRALPTLDQWLRALLAELVAGTSPHGGVRWNRHTNLRNTASTAPAALALFRAGRGDLAAAQLDWLFDTLLLPNGLLADGLNPDTGEVDQAVYTYNQGPVLALLLTLPRSGSGVVARDLVRAVDTNLTVPAQDGALVTHGSGDGGLFTGILARYLAVAARDPALPVAARSTAQQLVLTTADALWAGSVVTEMRGRPARLFPGRAGHAYDATTDAELSTQVQAWTVLEAAALLDTQA